MDRGVRYPGRAGRMPPGRGLHLVCAGALLLVVFAAVLPAAAQEMLITGPDPYDRGRVSGFWWRGETNGSITAPQFEALPGVDGGLDVTTDLGVDGGANGWLLSADFGAARRHRVMFAFAGLSQSGVGEFGDEDVATFFADSAISLRDVRAAYKFLFVARRWINVGLIGGLGYFNADVELAVNGPLAPGADPDDAPLPLIAEVRHTFESAYPVLGASLFFDAEDVLAVYAELTGFPSVEVGSQKGWLTNLALDFIVSPTDYISIVTGYKRYQLSLEDGSGIGIDLVWDGFVVGAQYVY